MSSPLWNRLEASAAYRDGACLKAAERDASSNSRSTKPKQWRVLAYDDGHRETYHDGIVDLGGQINHV